MGGAISSRQKPMGAHPAQHQAMEVPHSLKPLMLAVGVVLALIIYSSTQCCYKKSQRRQDGGRVEAKKDERTHLPQTLQADILAFFTYTQQENYRLVSKSCNEAVIKARTYPVQVRPIYPMFRIRREARSRGTNAEGLIDGRHIRVTRHGRIDWMKLTKRDKCCTSLRDWVADLVAQRIYVGTPAHVIVLLEVDNGKGRHIVLGMRNELTSESAFHLIHYLSHLNGCAFRRADVELNEHPQFSPGRLNPQVFREFTVDGVRLFELHFRIVVAEDEDGQGMEDKPMAQALEVLFTLH